MRWLALTGVAFVGCFAIAVLLYGSGAGSSSVEIATYYATPMNRWRQIAGFGTLAVGAIFLLSYLSVLRHALVRDPLHGAIATTSGAVSVALLSAANALWVSTALAAQLSPDYIPTAASHLLGEDAGFALVVTSMAAAIPLVAVTVVSARRSAWAPPWFTWLGALAALGLASAMLYYPIVLYLVWIVVGSTRLAGMDRTAPPSKETP